jgi:ankyrin repeat protein
VKLLLEKGTNAEVESDRDGSTSLWWAARNGYGAVLKSRIQ